MNGFKIFETRQFSEDLKNLFAHSEKIKIKLHAFVYPPLRQNPYFGKNIKKLRGYRPDTWRYRVGDFRFFYEIEDGKKVVYLIAADNRKDAY